MLGDILKELKQDKKNRPNWPDHIVAAAGLVSEASGDLITAASDLKYNRSGLPESERKKQVYVKAAIASAVAIRFLENLKSI